MTMSDPPDDDNVAAVDAEWPPLPNIAHIRALIREGDYFFYTARGHNLRFCSQPASARAIGKTPARTRAESDKKSAVYDREQYMYML
jgi:hypothetical protein